MQNDIRTGDWVKLKEQYRDLTSGIYKVEKIAKLCNDSIMFVQIEDILVPWIYFENKRVNKYHLGESVMISGMTLESPGVCSEMRNYAGRKAVITDINPQVTVWYRLNIDDSCFWWHESVLLSDYKSLVVDTENDIKAQVIKHSTESYLSNFNLKNNENQLQREEGAGNGRSNRTGSVICGRRRETSVAIGHLSNQMCPGK